MNRIKEYLAALGLAIVGALAVTLKLKNDKISALQGAAKLKKDEDEYDKAREDSKLHKEQVAVMDQKAKDAEFNYRQAVRNYRTPPKS